MGNWGRRVQRRSRPGVCGFCPVGFRPAPPGTAGGPCPHVSQPILQPFEVARPNLKWAGWLALGRPCPASGATLMWLFSAPPENQLSLPSNGTGGRDGGSASCPSYDRRPAGRSACTPAAGLLSRRLRVLTQELLGAFYVIAVGPSLFPCLFLFFLEKHSLPPLPFTAYASRGENTTTGASQTLSYLLVPQELWVLMVPSSRICDMALPGRRCSRSSSGISCRLTRFRFTLGEFISLGGVHYVRQLSPACCRRGLPLGKALKERSRPRIETPAPKTRDARVLLAPRPALPPISHSASRLNLARLSNRDLG